MFFPVTSLMGMSTTTLTLLLLPVPLPEKVVHNVTYNILRCSEIKTLSSDVVAFNFILPTSFPFMKACRAWPRDSMWRKVWEPASSSIPILQKNIEVLRVLVKGKSEERLLSLKGILYTLTSTTNNHFYQRLYLFAPVIQI